MAIADTVHGPTARPHVRVHALRGNADDFFSLQNGASDFGEMPSHIQQRVHADHSDRSSARPIPNEQNPITAP